MGAHKGAAVGGGGGGGGGGRRSLIDDRGRGTREEESGRERIGVAGEGGGGEAREGETNTPEGGIGQKLTVPSTLRKREIKHCATVFHPGASAKREASLGCDHAPVCRRLAGPLCTKRRMLRVYIYRRVKEGHT